MQIFHGRPEKKFLGSCNRLIVPPLHQFSQRFKRANFGAKLQLLYTVKNKRRNKGPVHILGENCPRSNADIIYMGYLLGPHMCKYTQIILPFLLTYDLYYDKIHSVVKYLGCYWAGTPSKVIVVKCETLYPGGVVEGGRPKYQFLLG